MKHIRVAKISSASYNKLIEAGFTVSFADIHPVPDLIAYKAGVKLPMVDMKKISAPARKIKVCNFPHVRRSK